MDYETRDFLKTLAVIIGGVCLLFGLLGLIAYSVDRASCAAKFSGSGIPSRYTLMGGCQVNPHGQGWIPAANYRVL